MQTHFHSKWWLRIATFSVAAMAAASATYWVLKIRSSPPRSTAAEVIFPASSQPAPLVVARLLGGGKVAVNTASGSSLESASRRFTLTGVVAERSRGGYAVISIDGKPAQAYRVGQPVNEALVLQSVAIRSAVLAASLDAPASFTLELPALASPGTGVNPASPPPRAQAAGRRDSSEE